MSMALVVVYAAVAAAPAVVGSVGVVLPRPMIQQPLHIIPSARAVAAAAAPPQPDRLDQIQPDSFHGLFTVAFPPWSFELSRFNERDLSWRDGWLLETTRERAT